MSTTGQRQAALERANGVRGRRARFHGELRAMRWQDAANILADTIADMPDWLDTIPVARLLDLCPQLGSMRVGILLTRAGVGGRSRLCDVDLKRRRVLCGLLIDWSTTTAPSGRPRVWDLSS
jgi:hypothetical protein